MGQRPEKRHPGGRSSGLGISPGSGSGSGSKNRGAAARRAASAIKVHVSRSARLIGEESIQIHGGMGTTDELHIGHYVKRLLALEALFGGTDYHLDRYAALID